MNPKSNLLYNVETTVANIVKNEEDDPDLHEPYNLIQTIQMQVGRERDKSFMEWVHVHICECV